MLENTLSQETGQAEESLSQQIAVIQQRWDTYRSKIHKPELDTEYDAYVRDVIQQVNETTGSSLEAEHYTTSGRLAEMERIEQKGTGIVTLCGLSFAWGPFLMIPAAGSFLNYAATLDPSGLAITGLGVVVLAYAGIRLGVHNQTMNEHLARLEKTKESL